MPASQKLSRFLINLSKDPSALQELKRDPHGYLAKTDLSDEEKKVILTADPGQLRAAIMGDKSSDTTVVVVAVVVVVVVP